MGALDKLDQFKSHSSEESPSFIIKDDKPLTSEDAQQEATKQTNITEMKSSQSFAASEAANVQREIARTEDAMASDPKLPLEDGRSVYVAEANGHTAKVLPQKGTKHNYLVRCSCAWEGRFRSLKESQDSALLHVNSK